MPRFVLLYHDCPPGFERPSHWDLMLEDGDALATWALLSLPKSWKTAHIHTVRTHGTCPPLSDSDTVAVTHLPRHRLAYLDYEGPVSNNRGSVLRVASGSYQLASHANDCKRFSCDEGLPPGENVLQRCTDDGTWQLTCVG